MISSFYGRNYSLDFLRSISHITRNGVSLLGLSEASEKIGFKTLVVKLDYEQLTEEVPLPAILHWNQEHFVVLYDIKKRNWFNKADRLIIGDPGHNLVEVHQDVFEKCWQTSQKKGFALLLEPTPDFHELNREVTRKTNGFSFLFEYLKPYKAYFFQLFLGMVLASLISLCFPFLTQSLVDFGVNGRNINFIHLILISQLLLFLGGICVDIIRNWLLLHISSRISITIISNFLIKLMKLPISFFESKNIGDITQRINDHHRIETFLTGSTLSTLFSIVNLVMYSFVLSYYNVNLFVIFLVGSLMSVGWIFLFLKRRKHIDYNRFQRSRENQNSIYEIITGMQEIKLYNGQRARRWDWERIQSKLFKVNIKSLSLEQYQEVGASFFTQLKNIIISYTAAMLVIEQQISLGVMLSISYIVGQMNSPLNQIIQFIRNIQDAKISLDRLGEIHSKNDEEVKDDFMPKENSYEFKEDTIFNEGFYMDAKNVVDRIQMDGGEGIRLDHVSFRYGGSKSRLILHDINVLIPKGKVTAIVGASGSGKTTLLKLLLKFYPPTEGKIMVDQIDLNDISSQLWRNNCGTVMQDGYIFSDSIIKNIAVSGEKVNEQELFNAVKTANLHEYINSLPIGFNTRIGNTGSGLSGGQKQRLFIARAVYKDPNFLFFDEATSALDSNNERIIMNNLDAFYKGRTVVVIAHRLSTVKNADQIIVMDNGTIAEQGNHNELVHHRGIYYSLVKNQLELENS
ncbi:peptidase domain-containing ABC transporter [Sphingobacterium sp.]|uniref:peptidase domain-containing ABC transporter n=1 Tax=Sphingobacterium sp. TaxID=341027 RepID=UPI0039170A33